MSTMDPRIRFCARMLAAGEISIHHRHRPPSEPTCQFCGGPFGPSWVLLSAGDKETEETESREICLRCGLDAINWMDRRIDKIKLGFIRALKMLTLAYFENTAGVDLDLSDLEDKWRNDSPENPICALCGYQIGSPEEDEEAQYLDNVEPEVPIRILRDHPDPARAAAGEKQEMAFHWECAKSRLIS